MKLFKNNPYTNWSETRKIGKRKYALSHGVVFAVLIFGFNLALMVFDASYRKNFTVSDMFNFLFIALVIGIFGHYTLMWWVQEKLDQNKKKDHL